MLFYDDSVLARSAEFIYFLNKSQAENEA